MFVALSASCFPTTPLSLHKMYEIDLILVITVCFDLPLYFCHPHVVDIDFFLIQAVKQIREVNILDDESLYTIFHNIRLTESAVHHSIFLEMMKKLVTSERWDPAISSVGSIFYDTVST